MKNIHVLPTDKPSRLHTYNGVLNLAAAEFVAPTIVKNNLINLNIYITNDEEIKEGDWCYDEYNKVVFKNTCAGTPGASKKIILTTDQDLIKDGVQAIDDEFLEWFVKNPSCEFVKIVDDVECLPMPNIHIHKHIYKIIIPQEKPKEMSKLTAVEWLVEKLILDELIEVKNGHEFLHLQSKAKEMEKQQSQNYAIFAIRCDRTEMRILDFNDYIKLVKNEEK
jgi:hypothetical protein